MRSAVAVLILMLALPGAALAASAAQKVPPPPAPAAIQAPPYEDDLLRLSEILGAMHYLRELCGAQEGDQWRDQMQKLLDTEQPDEAARARMVDRFNRGYDSYKSVYLSCTPAASEASDRYLDEGAKIAAEMTARYGR
ncbi:MAG: TIGR02301 family protein [Bauldia sp.]